MIKRSRRKFIDKAKSKEYTQIVYKYYCERNDSVYILCFDKNIWWKPVKLQQSGLVGDSNIACDAKSWGWLFFQIIVSKFYERE